MHDILPSVSEIDEQIAAARENIRELIEQAAAYSGAAAEELGEKFFGTALRSGTRRADEPLGEWD